MTDLVLDARGVIKRFQGLTAVRRVDLQISRQAIASLIGPNGAGKTTFFNCITGFYVPDAGDIIFQGRSIKGLRPDQITQRGVARTFLQVEAANAGARALYARLGYATEWAYAYWKRKA